MSQLLITHPGHPEIQFTKQEADFLRWFFANATKPTNLGDDFIRKAALRIPKIEADFWQRINALLDIHLTSQEERV